MLSPTNTLKPEKRLTNVFKVLHIVVGTGVTLLGFVVLIGWHTQNTSLTQIQPTFVPMQYNTALGFFLCGVGLILSFFNFKRIAASVGGVVFFLGALSFIQYLFDLNFGIDELFMKAYTTVKTSHPGRMAPNTAISFTLFGLGLFFLNTLNFRFKHLLIASLGTIASAHGVVALGGYIVNVSNAYGWGDYTNMAVHTALGFTLGGVSLFVYAWQRKRKSSSNLYYLPIVSLLLGLTLTLCLWQATYAEERNSIQRAVDLESEILRDFVKGEINKQILTLERMVKRWEIRGGTPRNEWETDAGRYIKDLHSYQEILWIDSDFLVRWIVPQKENSEIINADLAKNKRIKNALEEARDKKIPTLSKTVNLLQGGRGILVYAPIYVENKFDGFILGVWKVDKFFESVLPKELLNNYSIKLYEKDKAFYERGSFNLSASSFVGKKSVTTHEASFDILLHPNKSTISRLSSPVDEGVLFSGILLSFAFSLTIFLLQKVRQQSINKTMANSVLEHEIEARKRMEDILRQNSTFREAILNSSEYSIISTNKEGIILTFNKAAQRLLGYKATEVVGKHTPAIIHNQDEVVAYTKELNEKFGYGIEPGFETFVVRSKIDNIADEREWTYIRKDGTTFPIMLSVTALKNADDEITGYLGIGRDISELKTAKEKLIESEERFKTFMNNSPAVAFMKDGEGKYVYISQMFETTFKKNAESLLGKTDFDWLPEHVGIRIKEQEKEILETQKSKEFIDIIPNGDGSNSHWLFIKFPVFDGHEDYYLGGVGIDITDLENTNVELKKSEERFKAFMNNSPASAFIKDADGKYVYVNKIFEENSGFPAEKIIGRTDEYWADSETFEKIHKQERQILATDQAQNFVDEVIGENGIEKYWLFIKFPVPDGQGGTQIGGMAIDVTEQKQLEADLKQARDAALETARLKSEFLANMSHEIRTPMNGVMGMMDILLDTDLNEEQSEYAKTIQESANSLMTIINDILDFSKIEAGKLNFETIDFDLRLAVENTVELFAERAQRKNLVIASLVESDVPVALQGDPGRLRQVLTNLIGNAIKFTDEGEVIARVTKGEETDTHMTINFSVSDTGIGIETDAQVKLFEAFTQADGSMTRKYGGTGLGLSISKQLVEMMDGDISVESKVGGGSTFTFTATFKKQPFDELGNIERRENLENTRILIVDDNETSRKIISHQVKFWGVNTKEISDGETAIEMLKTAVKDGNPFDLILLDLMMPEKTNGFDIAKKIREIDELSDLKIILMPSFGERGHGKNARDIGIDGYLVKPIRQSDLYDCIATVLSSKQKIKLFNEDSQDKVQPLKRPKLITRHILEERRLKTDVKILVAEDNIVNQKVAKMQLEILGCKADIVNNGLEVLEALKNNSYALVLMDCQMPKFDGYQTTRKIRNSKKYYKDIPIIAITASVMESDKAKCLAVGMNDYLSKPFKQDELEKIIKKWVSDETNSNAPKSIGNGFSKISETSKYSKGIKSHLEKLDADVGKEMVEMIISLFIEDSEFRIQDIKEFLAEKDYVNIASEAHNLKAGCDNIGADYIINLCLELEKEALARHKKNVEKIVKEIEIGFEEVSRTMKHITKEETVLV